jgi:four helix bundle protein
MLEGSRNQMDDAKIVRKKIECFEDLIIWQRAIEFAKEIYLITERKGLKTDFGLKGQMRDSAVSISSNIAEGFERRSRKEYLNFLNIAKGSAGEIRSQLYVAHGVGYLNFEELEDLREKARFLSGSISNHMKSILNSSI